MLPCDFRTHSECSCEPHQCRVQRLPTTTKANDMADVFNIPVLEQFIRICLAGLFLACVWGTYQLNEHYKTQDMIEQENR